MEIVISKKNQIISVDQESVNDQAQDIKANRDQLLQEIQALKDKHSGN